MANLDVAQPSFYILPFHFLYTVVYRFESFSVPATSVNVSFIHLLWICTLKISVYDRWHIVCQVLLIVKLLVRE